MQCDANYFLTSFTNEFGSYAGTCVEHTQESPMCDPNHANLDGTETVGFYSLDASHMMNGGQLWRPWPGRTCDMYKLANNEPDVSFY